MADNDQEKRHEPSEKKWKESAERGQIARSPDLHAAGVILAGTAALVFASGSMTRAMRDVSVYAFDVGGVHGIGMSDAFELGGVVMSAVARGIAFPMGAVLVVTLVIGVLQSQFQIATKVLEPKWERVDPIGNFKNRYASWTPLVDRWRPSIAAASY